MTRGHPLCWTANYNVPGDFCKAIRTADWKYIWYADGFQELYDLRHDPHEWTNLALRAEYRTQTAEMKMRLLEWNVLSEDPLDPDWHRQHVRKYDRWK